MKPRIAILAVLVAVAYGCASTGPVSVPPTEAMQGVASWYGQEFAGRTTANGEIFDPLLLTAAHRTLPFGTVVDVTNAKTKQTVRVRVNDRGPYVGNRVIDLSYAAAQQIGLIEPGIGNVQMKIVRLGAGEREPPAPFEATAAATPKTATQIAASDAPAIEFPIPATPATKTVEAAPPPVEPVVVDRVEVQTVQNNTPTRRQVSADGTKIVDVPVDEEAGDAPAVASAVALDAKTHSTMTTTRSAPPPAKREGFVVQVGAFSVEENAKLLTERLAKIGQSAWIDREELFRVRIGPFASRDEALETRTNLEANGISAIVMRAE
ncbi:MAG TPA: septal ring lytic transglycosylase RlpA family protein [Thermoanaerobaculia bacterium]|nr:septal ring lytic transglycosylase RlpA family protein [Thermoanaerobaculia bacterium]